MGVLGQGGNAVDAAVATGLALGVVDQFNSGIGGGGFLLMRLSDGRVHAIDGREKAPAAASRDMYVRDGDYDPALSKVGPLAVAVPGILAAYEKALELGGSRPLGELIEPAVSLAENGFSLDTYLLHRYGTAIETLGQDPASAEIYLRSDGSPLKEGDVLKQADLAETYRRIGREGSDYFYRGEFARRLAAFMKEKGGLITLEDMRDYRVVMREPIKGTYRDYTVFGMPPPSSGGVHVLQILNMLEVSRALQDRSAWDPDAVFRTSRFMCRAFEDRAVYLGDSDFVPVPLERLTSKAHAEEMVKGLKKESDAPKAVSGSGVVARPEGGHTTSFVVMDRKGNVVAVNQTVNLTYGAKITLPGTGVILNNQMDDFSAQPGTPNAFGLVGSEANAIEGGKRPLSSMSPTILVKGAKPVMALGGAGGPTIITAVLQVIVNVLDLGMDLPKAMSSPRFHHQYLPDVLVVEKESPLASLASQGLQGQPIVTRDYLGVVNAIAWSEKEKAYVGVSDPRARKSVASLRLGDPGR
jgi:gamma-glutamyltranspeptidase/glutathione hydrolase